MIAMKKFRSRKKRGAVDLKSALGCHEERHSGVPYSVTAIFLTTPLFTAGILPRPEKGAASPSESGNPARIAARAASGESRSEITQGCGHFM